MDPEVSVSVCAAELLTQASRLVMLDVVRIIFRRLPDLPPSAPPPESAALHPLRSGAPHMAAGSLTLERDPTADAAPDAAQQRPGGLAAGLPGSDGGSEAALGGEAGREAAGAAEQPALAVELAALAGLDLSAAAGVPPPIVQ